MYDYIHQHHGNSFNQQGEMDTPPPLVRSSNIRADYQVPPPPRPIERINNEAMQISKYVSKNTESLNDLGEHQSQDSKNDAQARQIRLPSLSVITSTLRLRSKERGDSATAFDEFLDQTKESNFEITPKKKEKLEEKSPEYQLIQSPPHQALPLRHKDPYGTMRASKRIGGRIRNTGNESVLEFPPVNKPNINEFVPDYEDDVFAAPEPIRDKTNSFSLSTLPSNPSDPFGTLRANKAINNRVLKRYAEMEEDMKEKVPKDTLPMAVISNKEKHLIDYRGIPANHFDNNSIGSQNSNIMNEDLIITDELLQLLEDFKTKSYSMKEMEMLFENWRRKAAIYENGSEKPETLPKVSDG